MTPVEVLGALARVNLAGGVAILAVAALRKPARAAFGARVAYGLWLLPILASAAALLPARRIVVADLASAATAAFQLPAANASPTGANLDMPALLVGVWLAGVLVTALYMARLQLKFAHAARFGTAGPAVIGLIAPAIVTPRDFHARFSPEEQELILAHEQTHIRQQDSRLNGLSCAAQCLCWFNPLMHLAAHLMRIDQELACDEAVVTQRPDIRRAYAQVLVKAQLANRPLPLGCYWPSRSEHPLLERIAMLKRKAFSPARRWAGAGALSVLCASVGFAAWAAQPAEQQPALPAPAAKAAPIDITANQMRVIDGQGHRALWVGDAIAVQGANRLMADEIRTDIDNGMTLVASGHVFYASSSGGGRADHATYAAANHTLTLIGNVVANQGGRAFRGQTLVIDLTK